MARFVIYELDLQHFQSRESKVSEQLTGDHFQFWLDNVLVRLGEHQREGAKLRLDYLQITGKAESYQNVDC